MASIAVIGGGPAGLRAAETAAALGSSVHLFDAKPSVGRKFLVAGKGGLNLTHSEPRETFATRYRSPDCTTPFWTDLLTTFSPTDLQQWAAELGSPTFTASTGRVYPKSLTAAPLLRAWVRRIRASGASLLMRHSLQSIRWDNGFHLAFDTPSGPVPHRADAVILALGGASWPATGSDGRWTNLLSSLDIPVTPFAPANCGWECGWPDDLIPLLEGRPLKALELRCGNRTVRGELMLTRHGIEGGAIYQLGHVLREQQAPEISIDFRPHTSVERLIAKLGPVRRNLGEEARVRWRLDAATHALLTRFPQPRDFTTPEEIATLLKSFPLPLLRPRPIDEAISSAGGVRLSAVDDSLMVRSLPGLFLAGEMLDWEAPTGGYLLQACFATGTRAARAATAWLTSQACKL
jgi:uncharacterized flavoprotein (TIGR03862 family)